MTEEKQAKGNGAKEPLALVQESDLRLLGASVARLAQFLARPEALHQAIRDRYSVAGALPADWQTLLELLPKTGPMLEVSGQQGKWLVDIHSTAKPAGGRTIFESGKSEGVEYAEPLAAGIHEGPKTHPELEAALKTVSVIESIDREIRQLTVERLNLSKLAAELRIIDVSPPYEAFVASAVAIADGAKMPAGGRLDLQAIEQVMQYNRNLDRAAGSIQKAFFLATLLAESGKKGYSPRTLTSALQLIATELEFSSSSTEEIQLELHGVVARISDSHGKQAAIRDTFEGSLNQPLQPGTLGSEISLAQGLSKELINLDDPSWERDYYRQRAQALVMHLRTGERLQSPDLNSLRLRFAERVPAFFGDPNTISLTQYMRVLDNAAKAEAVEFAMTLFLKLGFIEFAMVILKDEKVRETAELELWEDLAEQAAQARRRSERVVLFTRNEIAWPPSRRYATVQLENDDLMEDDMGVTLCLLGDDMDKDGRARLGSSFKNAPVAPLALSAASVDESVEAGLAWVKSHPPQIRSPKPEVPE